MALKDLNDEEIQEYLDKVYSKGNSSIPNDMKISDKSKRQVAQYVALYDALNRDIPLNLSKNFSQAVLARIQGKSAEKSAFPFWQIIHSILGAIFGLSIIFYFARPKFWSWSNIKIAGLQKFVVKFIDVMNSFFSGLDINLGLLGVGLLMLIVMSVLDQLIVDAKQKFFSLFR